MKLIDYLKIMVHKDGSDLYISSGAQPSIKVHGKLQKIGDTTFENEVIKTIAYETMNSEQIQQFEAHPEMNLALSISGLGRFRVNIFRQRSNIAMVVRAIKTQIPSLKKLGLPQHLHDLIMQKWGLVLVVGATGSGKSTTLASLIDYRNANDAGHIITIEDPIEFTHPHKKSIVNQREVGVDTDNYEDALQNTLRQAPDVILIGEIRSRETMEHAIAFAETGHLCLSTLHANNANQAMERIINFFPKDRSHQVLLDVSLNLKGIISQRLIPTIDNTRTAAVEILLGTPLVKELIKRGEVDEIKDVMEKSEHLGMQTFDMSLFKLYEEGKITQEHALQNADSQNNLRLKISLKEGVIETPDTNFEIERDQNTFINDISTSADP